MSSKTKKLWLLPLAVAGTGFVLMGALNRGNVAQTTDTATNSLLHPRHYQAPLATVYQELLSTIPTLRTYGKPWRVVSHEENEVRAEVPVLMFTDDLIVTLTAAEGGTLLNVHSAARLGNSDFGENRRHILQLLAGLDTKFSSAN